MGKIFVVIVAVLCVASKSYAASAPIINNEGEKIGVVSVQQGTQGVVIRVEVKGLPAGVHGMHFHTVGDCHDTEKFKAAKGHINPHDKPHGFFNVNGPHEGNLPNLIIHKDGTAHVELYSELVSVEGQGGKAALFDVDGSSLIIHEREDDHNTQPIGGAGGRIACAVLKK